MEPPVWRVALRSGAPLPFQCRMVETDHAFVRVGGEVRRRNTLWREYQVGEQVWRELLYRNDCRVMYPADDLVTAVDRASSQRTQDASARPSPTTTRRW